MPQVRDWLDELTDLRRRLEQLEKRLELLRRGGEDLGGDAVVKWVQAMASMREILLRFYHREIQIKDLERGLIDFPAIIGGREVFLCWEQGEEDIEFWHDLDTGYAGREKLD